MEILFDKNMLAYCGLYCLQCSFKTAHDDNDVEHIKSLPFLFEIKDISFYDCDGCKGSHCICGNCKIKPCAIIKNLDSCADCKSFPCEHIINFENDKMPHHKNAIENLRYIKDYGAENWFKSIRPNLTCITCGKKQSWYCTCKEHSNKD